MKKSIFTLIIAFLFSATSFAQLSGTKAIPGDYPTVAAAIAALNSSGVGAGGVKFSIAAGYAETFTAPTDGVITTLSGTAVNTITFIKSGSGANPVITAATGTGTLDAVITVAGCDYVIFDGIDLSENAVNTEANSWMEWGYAILKATETDGSQNITIKNCTITLTNAYTASIGIYSNNHTTAAITQLAVTSTSGANSNLKIYSNTLSNCYSGIYLSGFNDVTSPYAFYDQNNEIGKEGANTITNVAGQATTAGYGIYAKGQNNLKVANNTITSAMGGSGSPSGIYLTSASNASYDLYNNTVSMQYSGGTGTTAFNAIFSDMGASGTGNIMNIYNNTVSGCTYTNHTSGNVYLMNFQNMGTTLNIYNNNIKNNTIGGPSATATGTIRYLNCNPSPITLGPVEFHHNEVSGNARIQSVVGGGGTNFIYFSGKNASLNMYNNLVTNNVISSSGTANLLYAGMDIGSQNVFNNTITNISKAEGQTNCLSQYNVTAGSGPVMFYGNRVQNIEALTASTYINGINIVGSNTAYFYNNFIGDLRAPVANGTVSNPDRIYGCYSTSSMGTVGLYNNTIYLNNTSTGANFGSAAVFISGSNTKLDSRNNILLNTSTPTGAGKTLVLKLNNATTYTNFSALSNYNNLYAGTPGAANCIFAIGTVTYQTLNDYKLYVAPREAQSVTEMPAFVTTTPGSMDLHLQPSIATQCESSGVVISTPIAVTNDFDLEARFPNPGYPVNGSYAPHAPDMGADEFGGIPYDITGPAIIFTNLPATYLTTNRTLIVTITDGSGVPTSGPGLPVLYWKINSGAYQAVQATWVSASTYSFSFGAGVVIGDIVSYYIVAQDNVATPNITSSPLPGAGGFTANPPACSTVPLAQPSYTILPGISGVYHVGVGKDYATITAAALDISSKYISGPLTLLLDDATYTDATESFPVAFISNPGSSPTNTLTIKPNAGVSPVISAEVSGGLLDLNGIDYMIIDGSNNGTNSKDLTISNPKVVYFGTYALSIVNNGGTDPVTNITIKNCKLSCVPVHASSSDIAPLKFKNTGGGHDNVIIDNNTISGGFFGIRLEGVSTNKVTNTQIIKNIIGSASDLDAISSQGIYMTYCDNTLISNNEIMGPFSGSLNIGQCGIYLSSGCSNSKIRKNNIHTFWRSADDGWGVSGIWFATAESGTVTEISNNVIYDIHSPGINPGVGQNITYGMFFRSGGNVKILNNTINLTGAYLSTSMDASSACLGFYYQATGGNFEVRNNILRNGMTTLGGAVPAPGSLGKTYGIMISRPPDMFSGIDNNDYFIDGLNGHIGQKYSNGFGIDADYLTLASWQAYTGQEANSVTIDPVFTSATNHLPTSATLNNEGAYIMNVPDDITGAMRSNPSDIGAYEFGDGFVHTLSPNSIAINSATVNGEVNTNGATVSVYFDYGTTSSYGNSIAANPGSVSGTSTNQVSLSLSGLDFATTYHYRARSVSGTGFIMYGADLVFTTLPAPPTVITDAATAVSAGGANLNGSVNANGGATSVTIEYGLTTAYGTTLTATPGSVSGLAPVNVLTSVSGLLPYTTYHFRVVATNVSGTVNGNDMTFTTLAIPSTVTTLAASNILGPAATLNGSVNANFAPTDVTFEWGLTIAYGNTINAIPLQATGNTLTPVSASIGGLTTATVYHFRCVSNGPGGTVYGNDMIFTSDCPTPALPGVITGPATLCKNTQGVVYSVDPVSGATGYNWALPAGATIASGANTNSITVDFSASVVNGNITVSGSNSCGSGSFTSLAVTFSELPVPALSGPVSICQGTTANIYTTDAGMTNYVWNVTGGTITSGTGTNSITVTWNTTGAQSVTVNYANNSGCSAVVPVSYPVNVLELPVPVISGANVACESALYIDYTTEPGMTNYVWDMTPNSGTITQSTTNVTTVFWTAAGAKWVSVSYTGANGCSAAAPTVYNVTVNPLPATPGTISGQSTVCAGTNSVTYSVTAVSGASGYTWSVPAGATIASGAGTNSITVNFSTSASSGNISVAAQNSCGDGQASVLPVTVNTLPATAGAINGTSVICQGTTGISFTVAAITGASSYNWTVPAGATIVSGSGTTGITVDFGLTAVSGDVTVSGVNACGTGTASAMMLTVTTKPATPVITQNQNVLTSDAPAGNQWYLDGYSIAGATSQNYTITEDGTYTAIVTLSGCSSDVSNSIVILHTDLADLDAQVVTVYPNPSNGAFWLSINSKGTAVFVMEVISSSGSCVYKTNNIEVNGTFKQYFDLQNLSAGMYTLILRSDAQQIVKKIVINK